MTEHLTGRHLGPVDPLSGPLPDPDEPLTATLVVPADSDPGSDPGSEPAGEPPRVPVLEAARQRVVCPECGSVAEVTLNRRESGDFCPRCDYPLFWVRGEVLLDRTGAEESLRRLPGTAGRVSVGSATCPTCAEANKVDAVTCLRCGGPMVLPAAPVVQAPPPPPPPAPAPEPEPERGDQWLWVVAGISAALLVVVVLYVLLR